MAAKSKALHLLLLTGLLATVVVDCSSPASEELYEARRALGRGRYREAIDRYTEVTLQAPGSPEAAQALYDVALIYYLKLRDLETARSTFRKLLTFYPTSPVAREARVLLARMYEEDLGDPHRAIEEYALLIQHESDPAKDKTYLLKIAQCRYSLNQLDEAAEDYRRIIEDFAYDEESDAAFLRLAHLEAIDGRAEEALERMDTLLEISQVPESRRRAYLMQAEILGGRGQFDEAAARFERAAEEFPGDPELASLEDRLHEQQEELARAAAEARASSELEKRVRWSRGRPIR
jgi:TolA-binding protein